MFRATVHVVSPRIDAATRTLRVKARSRIRSALRPGLFARADLGVATREDVPMIPEEAVLQRSDGSVVFVVRDGNRVERRAVRLGVFRDGLVEVVEASRPASRWSCAAARGSSTVGWSICAAPTAVDVLGARRPPVVAGAPEPARSIP